MELRRIAFTYSSGDTPLGEPGIAVVYTSFGYQEDASLLLRQQGTIQPGNTTADYDVIIAINQATSQTILLILGRDMGNGIYLASSCLPAMPLLATLIVAPDSTFRMTLSSRMLSMRP